MHSEPPVVYLDYNATAPLKPAARAAMLAGLELWGNPASLHQQGQAARQALRQARQQLAQIFAVHPDGIIFTAGGTEANLLALRGLSGNATIISAVEHDSVRANAPGALVAPVDGNGVVILPALHDLLGALPAPTLVSVLWAQNETGVIQPVAEIAALVRAHGGLFHVDAVQAPGRLRCRFAETGADAMTIAAHKFGGPKGVGMLLLRPGLEIKPVQRGGGQELGRRAGTENLAAIMGMSAAAATLDADLARLPTVRGWRDALEMALTAGRPEARICGLGAERLANTLCLATPGLKAETQLMALDLEGIAVSAGAACASGKIGPSAALLAMGLAPELAACAVRISLGWQSCDADIARLIAVWDDVIINRIAKAA